MSRNHDWLGLMNHPERSHHEQLQRIDRLIDLAFAKDHFTACPGLDYYDLVVLSLQAMWNLKDWILNDPEFGAANVEALKQEIFHTRCLMVCSDLANGTKHFRLNNPKTTMSISDRMGLHVDALAGIYQQHIYILAEDPSDPLFGIEARAFIQECRSTWQRLIDKHYLSNVYE